MNIKEAINILANCIDDYVIGDFCVGKFCPMESECKDEECPFHKSIETVLAELEKKDRQLEERTNRIRNLERECQKHFDNMMEVIQENSKKDKIINLMAEQITTPVHSKEWVMNYFEKKIEEGNNDRDTEII